MILRLNIYPENFRALPSWIKDRATENLRIFFMVSEEYK